MSVSDAIAGILKARHTVGLDVEPFDVGLIKPYAIGGIDVGFALFDACKAGVDAGNQTKRADACEVDVAFLIHEERSTVDGA